MLAAWQEIPSLVARLVDGLGDTDLDRRLSAQHMSIRETVHHIAEANVVAAAILTAALGSPGCVFDWSWMLPFGPWMERVRHDRKPLAPSLHLLDAINAYVVAQLAPLDDGLTRKVRLRDEPEGALREVTVADVLWQEIEHARGHVAEVEVDREKGC